MFQFPFTVLCYPPSIVAVSRFAAHTPERLIANEHASLVFLLEFLTHTSHGSSAVTPLLVLLVLLWLLVGGGNSTRLSLSDSKGSTALQREAQESPSIPSADDVSN